MERKRKIRRAFILIFAFYIVINIFIFGLMKAYINTNNIVSRNQLVMASVTEKKDTIKIKVLSKSFELDKDNAMKSAAEACVYAIMPENARVCTDIILTFGDIILHE